jgi:pimeloyl-ACP methyl ester carboxylesterase
VPGSPIIPTWRTLRVDGRRVELMEAGRGDPLLFLHGWGLTPRTYADAVVRLCAAGVRVIAPSMPGFGHSEPLPLGAPLPAWARQVAALVDALDPPRAPFVVGHSFGGGVALQLAVERPDLVRSLTLVNSVGGRPGKGAQPLAEGSWMGWLSGAVGELDPRPWLHPKVLPTIARDYFGNLVRHPLSMAASMVTALSASLAEEAEGVVASGVPTLLVWGDRDGVTVPGPMAGIAGDLGTEVVAGRHGWMITEPAEFARVIHDALVVHALLERRRRALINPESTDSGSRALRLPPGVGLTELLRARHDLGEISPPERRRRSRWP